VIYLNNAATSYPKAPGVVDAVRSALTDAPGPPGRTAAEDRSTLDECRDLIAEQLAVRDPHRIVLTPGSTYSINLALWGLGLRAAHRVVTTVTEHNSVLRPLYHLRERHGTSIAIVGLGADGALDMDRFKTALESGATLVAANHASNVTGRVNDVACLFSMAHEAGAVTLLDASQSLGHVPVHPEELGADLVAFTGHKGLLGPPGTGGLYVDPNLDLEPMLVGGTGVRSDLMLHPADMPTRLEAGTPNLPGFAGLAAALRWTAGPERQGPAVASAMAERLRDGLRTLRGVRLVDDDSRAQRVPVVSFVVDGWSVDEAGYALACSFGVQCRSGLHCAPLIHQALGTWPHGTVRLSPSAFTTTEEIARAVEAVARLAGCA